MLIGCENKIVKVVAVVAGLIFALALGRPALAETIKVDDGPLATKLKLPVYQWQDNQKTPRAVVLAIHGLTMHGTVFDTCARSLAADGAIVVAPDLRGYGAWYQKGTDTDINYEQSEKDVCQLAEVLRQQYKGLPMFVAGESLGGAMAIRLAAKHPELIDGLILCSPAIKMYHPPKALVDATLALANRSHELDISDYIKKNFSEDSQITEEGLHDPLIRRHLSMVDLLESCRFIAASRRYIGKIPAAIPVLVMQGEKDRVVRPSGVTVLESSLKTSDTTVRILPQRGHILLETNHVHSEDMKAIISWVDSECEKYNLAHARIAVGNAQPHMLLNP
jgi:alpha-beta hydrolase superfamily lysophospholipase